MKLTLAWKNGLGLAGLGAAALALRLFRIDFRSIWLDEAYSLRLASARLPEIVQGAGMDIHPPLYYLVLAGWIRLFGTSEFALRSLSAVFGVLLVLIAVPLVRAWAGNRAAWWTAAFVAISPYFIEISRSGRMAAMLAFWCAAALLCFWRVLQGQSRVYAVGYVLATLAGLYTHYFALLVLVAQYLYLFMGIGKLKLSRRVRTQWMWLQFFLLLGYLPWMPYFWEHISRGGPGWRGPGAVWQEPFLAMYRVWVGTACWSWGNKLLCLGLTAAAGLVLAGYWWPRREALSRLMPARIWGLMLTLVLVPLGVVWGYSQQKLNVFDGRYLSFVGLMLLAAAGTLVSAAPRWSRRVAALLLVGGFAVPLGNQYFVYGYYDNWRQAARTMAAASPPADAVVMYPAWNETPLRYYLPPSLPIQGLPGTYDPISGETRPYFVIDRESVDQIKFRLPAAPRLWLVLVNDGDAQAAIQGWFAQHYQILREETMGAITLRLCGTEPSHE